MTNLVNYHSHSCYSERCYGEKEYDHNRDYGCVYVIINLVNGKAYVGQTCCSIRQRIRQHRYGKEGCAVLQRAFAKYGYESFEYYIITVCQSKDELNKSERDFIKEWNTVAPNGMNIASGGGNGKMSDAHKNAIYNGLMNGNHHLCGTFKGVGVDRRTLRKGTHIYYPPKNPRKYKPISETQKRAISDKNSKAVVCVDTGMEFKSAREAAKSISDTACASNITSAAIGKQQSAYGFRWSYKDSPAQAANPVKYKRGRKIMCVETNIVYDSPSHAMKGIGKSGSAQGHIAVAARQNRVAYGFHWVFIDEGGDNNEQQTG